MSLDFILTKASAFFAVIAPMTPIKTDDELPALIDAIRSDAILFGWLEAKVAADEAGVLQMEAGPSEEMTLALNARGIDWAKLIQYLPAIIAIVKTLRG